MPAGSQYDGSGFPSRFRADSRPRDGWSLHRRIACLGRARGAAAAAPRSILGSQASFRVRVLPVVPHGSVGALARRREPSACDDRVELHAGARHLRLAIDGRHGAPRALDCRVGRWRDRRQLVGPRQQRQRGDPDADGRDGRARHPRHVQCRAVRRRSRAALRARPDVSGQELRRSPPLGLLPVARAGRRLGRSGVQVVPHDPAARRAPTATGRRPRSATTRQTRCGGGRRIWFASCCATTSIG